MKILFKIVIIIFIININIDIYAISSESEEHLYNLISESSISSCSLDSLLLVIEKEVDLGNERILIPPKAILVFKNGTLKNGTIVGDSTSIIANKFPIFDNVVIEGSWKIEDVKTDFFQTKDDHLAANLTSLISDKQLNKLYINHDLSIPIKEWGSFLTIKSNTDIILNADIYTLPTDHKGGYCINIDGNNIKVYGNGHFLFGCLASPNQKECSQWLHGLNITKNSNKIEVNDLNAWYFCGDGFYTSGSDISFNHVNAKFNGRQGLSITNGSNIKVINSTFTYTGLYKINSSGGPGAGIDIEPNKNDMVNNVIIEKCYVANNYKLYKEFQNDLEIYNAYGCGVKIIDCAITGLYLGSCSDVSISSCNGLESVFEIDNNVKNVNFYNYGKPFFSNKTKVKK